MTYKKNHRQSFQKRDDARSVLEVSTCEFAYNERVTHDISVVE
jgi:hypothetical protein